MAEDEPTIDGKPLYDLFLSLSGGKTFFDVADTATKALELLKKKTHTKKTRIKERIPIHSFKCKHHP